MSSDRRSLSEALSRLAFSLEMLDEDVIDAKACSGIAWAVRSMDGEITVARIASMDGVNVPLLAFIDDVVNERMPPLLADLERRIPLGLLEVRRIKGLGPKKIRALWQQLDITSIGELEYACKENRLVELKGFGKKTQDAVLEQIETLRSRAGFMRLDQALAIATSAVTAFGQAALGSRTEIAGDLRRRTEVVSGVDLVTTMPVDAARRALEDFARLVSGAYGKARDDDAEEDARDETKSSDSFSDGVDGARLKVQLGRAELRVHAGVDAKFFGAALVIDTGSAAHVAVLREIGAQGGANAGDGEREVKLEDIEGADERDVYARLGLEYVEPERREAGVDLVVAADAPKEDHAPEKSAKLRPRLVRVEDLRGSLHNHTTASDGDATLVEMRDAAAARGYAYLAITDHSQSAVYAKGLAASALSSQRSEIRALNTDAKSTCTLLSGVESDILKDGSLDYADEILSPLDVVIASVHSRFGQKGADLTARMVAAARNPKSDIVGHPTGRLLLGRAPAEYDVSQMLEAAMHNGSAVELNANPARLDLNEHHLMEAKARGLLVSIAADAHAVDELDNLEFGVWIARRAGLTAEDVLNSRSLDELLSWLKARRARTKSNEAQLSG